MGSYYYLEDFESEFGCFPVPEEDYFRAVFRVAKKHGLEITDREILQELGIKEKLKQASGKQKKKVHFYIDGTNLFAGQNELFGPEGFLSFPDLLKEISKFFKKIDEIYFYATYMGGANIKSKKLKELISIEAQFYRQVRSTPKVFFYKGHRSPTSGKEKGVDVHLAVDIVKHVFQKRCGKVIIMTGDADLIYPLQIVKSLGVPIHAVFLPNRFSLEMAYRVDSAVVLNYRNKFLSHQRKLPKNLEIVEIKSPVCKHTG